MTWIKEKKLYFFNQNFIFLFIYLFIYCFKIVFFRNMVLKTKHYHDIKIKFQ